MGFSRAFALWYKKRFIYTRNKCSNFEKSVTFSNLKCLLEFSICLCFVVHYFVSILVLQSS